MINTYSNGDLAITHNGTGSEVKDVLVPKGQESFYSMNEKGEGRFKIKVSGSTSGAANDITILSRSGGTNYVGSLVVPASESIFVLEVDIYIQSENNQIYLFKLTYGSGSVVSRKTEALNPSVTNVPLRIGVVAESGDTVVFETVEVLSTCGGIFN